ncbi:MAG TPA: hypothetical protein VIR30_14310 [Nocardioides sp.]
MATAEAKTSERGGQPIVSITFTADGSQAFEALTKEAACAQDPANRIVVIVDGEVISAPVVSPACGEGITGGTDIQGNFTMDEARALAKSIDLGR